MLSHRGLALGSFPPYPEFLTLGGRKEEIVVAHTVTQATGGLVEVDILDLSEVESCSEFSLELCLPLVLVFLVADPPGPDMACL